MDGGSQPFPADGYHNQNIERTLSELQLAIKNHETALNELRQGREPPRYSDHAQSAEASLDIMTQAYDDVTKSEPFLPFKYSVLPALVALRKTYLTIQESREYLKDQGVTLDKAKKRLEIERGNLADQEALREALEKRLASLRDGLETSTALTPEQIVRSRVAELKQKNGEYTREKRRLMVALVTFVRDHLGKQLAMEDLGGPVVGDQMDIDSEDLASDSDEPRSKGAKRKRAGGDGQRDRPGRRAHARGGSNDSDSGEDGAAAAAGEMIKLLEDLLNASAQSEDAGTRAYVDVARGSVPAEFLVRSKVALFHPGDATRLRLVDFGREVGE